MQPDVGTLRDWEQNRSAPDQAARAYLKVGARDPEFMRSALARQVRWSAGRRTSRNGACEHAPCARRSTVRDDPGVGLLRGIVRVSCEPGTRVRAGMRRTLAFRHPWRSTDP